MYWNNRKEKMGAGGGGSRVEVVDEGAERERTEGVASWSDAATQ